MDLIEYRLGFICARRQQSLQNQNQFATWVRILTPHHKVFVHPDTNVQTLKDGAGRTIIALGDIFVAHGEADLSELLLAIAGGDREATDLLSGRFALLVFDGDAGTVLHDPLGSQSVFYTLSSDAIVASHSTLLAGVIDASISRELQRYMQTSGYSRKNTRFLPGDLTLYEQIVHLIPNNELDMKSGITKRYWPRRPVASRTLADLRSVWTGYFSRYSNFLSGRYNPVIGLTGGLDSRTVIATLRSMDVEARFVTWDMGEEEAARIPGLVHHLGARHDWLRLRADAVQPEYERLRIAARDATGHTRGKPVLPSLMAALAGPRDVFVKGLGGEVMRGPWNTEQSSWLPKDVAKLIYRLYAGHPDGSEEESYVSVTTAAVEAFMRRANYDAELFGIDVGDLVYWEQRMGNWTSVQHAEMSIAMQSHSAMNSRLLFETSWGLESDARFSADLLPGLMRTFDPVLERL